MNKETVLELYDKYQKADYEFHKYMDGFFTTKINGTVINQAVQGRSAVNDQKIMELDKEVDKDRIAFEEGLKLWIASLK